MVQVFWFEGGQGLVHGRGVTQAFTASKFAHHPFEVILVLACQARHLLGARQVLAVTTQALVA